MRIGACVTLVFLLCAAFTAGAGELRWPLDEPRKLSSSFGEYRDGHYHAGLDLRTFGRIGLPCLAPDACEAVRLRVSPIGYGKAVYLRLRDGSTVVYGHLSGFSRSLDSLSYAVRLARGTSSFDIEVPPGFRFEAGEVVAYTGSSGSPFPHLHFETRDTAGRPFNPLVSLYRVADACPPIISALEAAPLVWGSLVNGSPLAWTGRFRLERDNRYALRDTLRLDGLVGFGVSAYDKQARGSYRMGPYSYELIVDGKTAYTLRNRAFDYSLVGDIPLEYEDRAGGAPGRYLVLFKRPANMMPDRDGVGTVTNDSIRTGALLLADGVHRGEIVVRDAAGNEARGSFVFRMERGHSAPRARGAAGGEAGEGALRDIRGELRAEGLYLRFRAAPRAASVPSVRLAAAGGDSLDVLPAGAGEFAAFCPVDRLASGENVFAVRGVDARGAPFEASKSFRIYTFMTGGGASFEVGDGVAVRFTAPSARGTAALMVRGTPPREAASGELVPVGEPFALDFPLAGYARPPRLDFDEGRNVGLFRWEGRGVWRCVGVPALAGGPVEVRRNATYALFRDVTPPVLPRLASTRVRYGSAFFRSALLYVPVHERGSGIDPESAVVTIDGERAVCEWDEYRSRLSIPIPRAHRGGPATILVEVADRAGNRASAEFACVIE